MDEERLVDLLSEYEEIIDRTEPDVLRSEDGSVVAEVEQSFIGLITDEITTGTIQSGVITADMISGTGPISIGIGSIQGSSMNISNEGFIITRNSNGEEVIRIDNNGIHINGTLVISTAPRMVVQVESPQDLQVRVEEERLGGLIRELFGDRSRSRR